VAAGIALLSTRKIFALHDQVKATTMSAGGRLTRQHVSRDIGQGIVWETQVRRAQAPRAASSTADEWGSGWIGELVVVRTTAEARRVRP